MRFFGCTSYDGTHYHGWQKQDTTPETIQAYIEKSLSILLRAPIQVTGCGRTDAGVHARGYYFHFDHFTTFNYNDVVYHANKILPAAITLHHIVPMDTELHARFDAERRSYIYKLKLDKNPFLPFHTEWPYALTQADFGLLNALAEEIKKAEDFTSFCKTGSDVENCRCTIYESYWTWQPNENELCYHITANRFLRGMIRLLTGMMLNVLRGKVTMEQAKAALHHQAALKMSWSTPPNGLTLHAVDYEKEELPPITMV